MSIEPECRYCGACDKNRCKTQEEADGCDMAPTKPSANRRVMLNSKPQVALTNHVGHNRVTVSTHSGGVAERLSVKIDRGQRDPDCHFILEAGEVDTFIELLQTASNYAKRGHLK